MGLLPKTPRSGKPDPRLARVLLYGRPKVGKTTLAWAWNPKQTLFLDMEGGTRHLPGEHFTLDVPSWATFEEAVRELAAGGHDFRTVVVDTVDRLYEACDRQVGLENGVSASGLVEYGRGTADTDGRFKTVVGRLLSLPVGVWFLSHAVEVDVEGSGKQVQPTLHKRVRDYVTGSTDYVLLAERQGTRAVLRTQPSARYQAGSREGIADPLPLDARALYGAIAAASGHDADAAPEQAAPPTQQQPALASVPTSPEAEEATAA